MWRSDVYGTFKDGKALTPFAVVALQTADLQPGARCKAAAVLAGMVKPDGTINEGEDSIDYPVYTAALSVVALSHPENAEHAKARDAWLKYLLERQLTEKIGWKPEDKQYGGWGYCRTIPSKPEPNKFAPPLIESNLSATVFALEALRAAGHADPEVYRRAEIFVLRCQNDDGGFHFIYDDPVRNKAGGPSVTPGRYYSYGSTTADGVRALSITEAGKARLPSGTSKAASVAFCSATPGLTGLYWLIEHFRPDAHPGDYIPTHERNRNAVYFYYAASAAKTLRAANEKGTGDKPWPAALSAELIRRQHDDGSWANPIELVRENDPIVATCNAMIALAECKAAK